MAYQQSINQQHLAYLRQQGGLAITQQIRQLVRQDLDQYQTQQAARLQAALEAHLVQPRPQQK